MKSKKKTQVANTQSGKECKNTQSKTKCVPKIRLKEDEDGQEIYDMKKLPVSPTSKLEPADCDPMAQFKTPPIHVQVRGEEYEDGIIRKDVIIRTRDGELSRITGSKNQYFAMHTIHQLFSVLPGKIAKTEDEINASLALLSGIAPQDELECALAAQMIAVHNLSMESLRKAIIPDQTTDGVTLNTNRAVKLSRTFVTQMEALQKYRNKGQQTIQVQHVSVEDGGQAVVGNVNTGGGGER